MKHIFNYTLTKMFKLPYVLIISVISMVTGLLIAKDYNKMILRLPTYTYLNNRMVITFCLVSFLLISGIVLWIVISNTSTGLFASEMHEGTLRLVVSKPLKRKELVMGKVSGMLVGSVIYLVTSMLMVLGMFSIMAKVDLDILMTLLKYSFVIILYGIFLTLFVGSIGSFLSTVFKKKVPSLLILVFIGFFTFAILPIARMILIQLGVYTKMNLYYFDINYHLGLMFNQFVNLAGGIQGTSNQINMINLFTNIFKVTLVDSDIALNSQGYIYTTLSSINVTMLFIVYSLISVMFYIFTFKRMEKIDI